MKKKGFHSIQFIKNMFEAWAWLDQSVVKHMDKLNEIFSVSWFFRLEHFAHENGQHNNELNPVHVKFLNDFILNKICASNYPFGREKNMFAWF